MHAYKEQSREVVCKRIWRERSLGKQDTRLSPATLFCVYSMRNAQSRDQIECGTRLPRLLVYSDVTDVDIMLESLLQGRSKNHLL